VVVGVVGLVGVSTTGSIDFWQENRITKIRTSKE
jgi:hypothetical protein